MATLVEFVHCLESSAHDDTLEVLEIILHDLFGQAKKAGRKARMRTLKDLDQAATLLAEACKAMLDEAVPDTELRTAVFAKTPRDVLERAMENVCALVRPPHDVYFKELDARYRHVRLFLPTLVKHIRFEASPAGKPVGGFRLAARKCDSHQTSQ